MPSSPAQEPFSLYITKSHTGTEVLVYANANGCGIYRLHRIVVSVNGPGWSSTRWFRPDDFEIGGAQVEPNLSILKARKAIGSGATSAWADGHYIRVDRRATTPEIEL